MAFMLHIQVIKSPLQPLALLCANNHHYHSSWTLWLPWRHGGISPSNSSSQKPLLLKEQLIAVSYKWSHSYLALRFLFQIKHRATESFVLPCKYASFLFLHDFSKGWVWKEQYPTWQRHSIHSWPLLPSEIGKKVDFHSLLFSLMASSEVSLSACSHCLHKCFHSENSSCLAAWVHAVKSKLVFLLTLCEIPWLEHWLSLYFFLSHLRCVADVYRRTPCS